MMGWQWHQLDYMQIIYTLLQTGNYASTSSLNFLRAGCSFCRPTNNVKALKASMPAIIHTILGKITTYRHLMFRHPKVFYDIYVLLLYLIGLDNLL